VQTLSGLQSCLVRLGGGGMSPTCHVTGLNVGSVPSLSCSDPTGPLAQPCSVPFPPPPLLRVGISLLEEYGNFTRPSPRDQFEDLGGSQNWAPCKESARNLSHPIPFVQDGPGIPLHGPTWQALCTLLTRPLPSTLPVHPMFLSVAYPCSNYLLFMRFQWLN
jgi:hypothetical protein